MIKAPFQVKVKCPYCGFENNWRSDYLNNGKNFVACDSDEGGCDQDFVVKVSVQVTTETFSISIGKGSVTSVTS